MIKMVNILIVAPPLPKKTMHNNIPSSILDNNMPNLKHEAYFSPRFIPLQFFKCLNFVCRYKESLQTKYQI